MLNIIFFAALREELQTEKITLIFDEAHASVGDIKTLLCHQNPAWHDVLINNSVLSAVNHNMVTDDFVVSDHDEIAFFPPVTGG